MQLELTDGLARITSDASHGKKAIKTIKKILLIQPPEASPVNTYVLPRRYPLALFTLAAVLEKKLSGFEIIIADLGLPEVDLIHILSSESPDLVGVTFLTPQYEMARGIVRDVRALVDRCHIVGGGVHATALPVETMADIDFHFLVIGEGEITFPELVLALDRKATSYDKIQGICYRCEGQARLSKPRSRLYNLDEFPLVTDVLPPGYLGQYANVQSSKGVGPIVTVTASRGCSFNCFFCASNALFFGQRLPILRSVKSVVAEVSELSKKHNAKIIRFGDDIFDLDRARGLAILEGLKKAGCSDRCDISYLSRARKPSAGDEEYYNALYKLGVKQVAIGIESGDESLMIRLGKPEGILYGKENTRLIQGAGIEVKYFLMVGLPGQDWASISKTIDLLKKDRPNLIGVSYAMPYPGTALYEMKDEIMFSGTYDKMIHEPPRQLDHISFIPNTSTREMTSKEIMQSREKILSSFNEIAS
jgi:radical SAM superfamily enzyme YgiQ (UPF0313 family)